MPSSVISSQSMHLGVLAMASHAIATHTMFTVYYKPRTSQFIVGVNKYLEAVGSKFIVGMRFKMRLEGEDVPERRYPAINKLAAVLHWLNHVEIDAEFRRRESYGSFDRLNLLEDSGQIYRLNWNWSSNIS